VEKYDRGGQTTDDNKIRRMRITCWIPKATDTLSEYLTINAFSTAKFVTRTRLHVTLYVHYLTCFKIQIAVQYFIGRFQCIWSVILTPLSPFTVPSLCVKRT